MSESEFDSLRASIAEEKKRVPVFNCIVDIIKDEEDNFKVKDWIDVWKKVGEDFLATYIYAVNGTSTNNETVSIIYQNARRFMETIITREEYRARRRELQDKIFDSRKKERKEIQRVEDDKLLARRNADNRIKMFAEKVENEKIEAIHYLSRCIDDIHRKYAAERAELDSEIKLLDAELKRAYYVNLKEGGEA